MSLLSIGQLHRSLGSSHPFGLEAGISATLVPCETKLVERRVRENSSVTVAMPSLSATVLLLALAAPLVEAGHRFRQPTQQLTADGATATSASGANPEVDA